MTCVRAPRTVSRWNLRRAIRAASAFALVACAGCASFSKPDLPHRELSDLTRDGKLRPVTYVIARGDAMSGPEFWGNATVPNVLQPRIEPIFRLAFAEATQTAEPGEWHLDIYYRETLRNPAVAYTLMLFSICSIGFLPAYTEEDLYLEAKLKHDGETVRQVVFEERVSTWLHWLVLPWAFRDDPIERKAEMIDGMVLNLLFALQDELRAPDAPLAMPED